MKELYIEKLLEKSKKEGKVFIFTQEVKIKPLSSEWLSLDNAIYDSSLMIYYHLDNKQSKFDIKVDNITMIEDESLLPAIKLTGRMLERFTRFDPVTEKYEFIIGIDKHNFLEMAHGYYPTYEFRTLSESVLDSVIKDFKTSMKQNDSLRWLTLPDVCNSDLYFNLK